MKNKALKELFDMKSVSIKMKDGTTYAKYLTPLSGA